MKFKYRYVRTSVPRLAPAPARLRSQASLRFSLAVTQPPPLTCRPTQSPAIDTLRLDYLIGPCVVLALIFNYKLYVPACATHPSCDSG